MAKVNLDPDFRELFASLNSAKVKYLLVGGYAVIHYGYQRTTRDLDIWIAVEQENARRISQALQSWGGFSARDAAPSRFLKLGTMVIFGCEPLRVDILTTTSGLSFDDAYKKRNVVDLDGIRVPLIALEDLRINKASTGRAKDQADLEYLTRVKRPAKAVRKKKN